MHSETDSDYNLPIYRRALALSPGPSGFTTHVSNSLRRPRASADVTGLASTSQTAVLARVRPAISPAPQASSSRPFHAGRETRLLGRNRTADSQPPRQAPCLASSPVLGGQSGAQSGGGGRRLPGSPTRRGRGDRLPPAPGLAPAPKPPTHLQGLGLSSRLAQVPGPALRGAEQTGGA